MDTYLQARQRRADHWRPLCIRFDSPRYHAVPGAPSPVRQPASALPTSARYARFFPAARAPATSATAALGPDGRPAAEAVGAGSLGTAGRGQSGSFGRWGGASTASGIGAAGSPPRVRIHRSRGLNRADVRLLRSSDANVRIPENIGKWLTQPSNCAPDALNRRRGQRILYTAKISLRFKDHILAQSPCAYALACPFPVMVAQYVSGRALCCRLLPPAPPALPPAQSARSSAPPVPRRPRMTARRRMRAQLRRRRTALRFPLTRAPRPTPPPLPALPLPSPPPPPAHTGV